MFPFERMNGWIKGFVRNRANPDGSIVQGYLTEECISFCTNYMKVENPIGLPVNKHVGRLNGKGHLTLKKELEVSREGRRDDFDRAHTVVLQHLNILDHWTMMHKNTIKDKYELMGQLRTDDQITREHNKTFAAWFKKHIKENPPAQNDENAEAIYALSQGPAFTLATYQAYDMNGYTFHTEERDKKSVYQNSGVTMKAWCGNEQKRYYGRLEEIWELDYSGDYKMAMFRVRWAKNVITEDRYFTTMSIPEAQPVGTNIGVKGITAENEPWVFAKDCDQCFFITDPTRPSRVVVRSGKRSILGVADEDEDERDFARYDDPKEEDDFDEPYTTRRSRTTLPKNLSEPYKRHAHSFGLKYSRKRKKTSLTIDN